ncbi:MAG: DUF3782 domain-containing protein [Magnetococcales bacterium]|nr:DUF3782 domain-containing protein [Magnetococcales bacterium]
MELQHKWEQRSQELQQNWEQRSQELDRQMRETDRKIKEVSSQIGDLGGRWGDFVEGIVAPACDRLFTERGIAVHRVSSRVKGKSLDGMRRMEIDLLVDNTDSVVLVEVKSNLTVDDVKDHLKRLSGFKEFFPRYVTSRVYGAVAGIVISAEADQFAMKKGLFVIVQSGETVKLVNPQDFKPKSW